MNIEATFHRPEQLPNPQPKYQELLASLYKSIGREQLEQRVESISAKWAMESGYYFFYSNTKDDNKFTFVHVSLNPKDFV